MSQAYADSPETVANPGVKCPLCGASSVVLEFQARDADDRPGLVFPILHCRECQLIFTGLAEDAAVCGGLYPEGYYGEETLLNRLAVAVFQWRRCQWMRRAAPPGKKILDLGAGNGRFVASALRRGWDAYGCDPSPVGKTQAAARGILPRIFFGPIENFPAPEGPFDLITLWQVLEHVENPAGILGSVFRLLRPGGQLVISAPNCAGLAFRYFHDDFFHLDVPRHRFHFSPVRLSRLLETCGFHVVRVSHFSLEYSPFGWWQTLLNACGLERNALYRWLKRGDRLTTKKGIAGAGVVAATVLCSLLALPLSFLLSFVEAVVGKGMIVTVVAERKLSA